MIKLTHAEEVKRSRLKTKMLAEDPTWTYGQIKLYFAQNPELWIPKKKPITATQYQQRLIDLKEFWCPAEIIQWQAIIESAELEVKKKD